MSGCGSGCVGSVACGGGCTPPSPPEKIPDIRVGSFRRLLSIAYEKRLELPNTSHNVSLSAQAVLPGR